MKTIKKLTMSLLLAGTLASNAMAGCLPGNMYVYVDGGDGDWCCVEVGDGSVWSCTDGDTWFLV